MHIAVPKCYLAGIYRKVTEPVKDNEGKVIQEKIVDTYYTFEFRGGSFQIKKHDLYKGKQVLTESNIDECYDLIVDMDWKQSVFSGTSKKTGNKFEMITGSFDPKQLIDANPAQKK